MNFVIHDRNRRDAARRENDTTAYQIIFRPHRCFVCKENSFATACEKPCESASRRTSFSFIIFPVNSYSWTGQRPHSSTWREIHLHHPSTVILYIKSFIVESNHTHKHTLTHKESSSNNDEVNISCQFSQKQYLNKPQQTARELFFSI